MSLSIKQIESDWQTQLKTTIYQHLDSVLLSIPFLAKQMYCSERQFYRRVKKCNGMTPNQYLQLCRLNRAKELLRSGKYHLVKEVCQAVGYKKETYFRSLFKQHFGKTPSEFLNN